MIYGKRSNDPGRANTKIEYKGYEISIAMDDGHRGRDLTRTSIVVYKDGHDVMDSLGLPSKTHSKITADGIIDPNGDDLFNILAMINFLEETRATEPDPLEAVADRDMHRALRDQ